MRRAGRRKPAIGFVAVMTLDDVDISACLPHAGSMVLLDRVESCSDETILCRASSHRDPKNPLRRHDRLAAVCGIEYAAQAAALHAVLTDSRDSFGGARLGGVSHIRASQARLDDIAGDILVRASVLTAEANGAIYTFSLSDSAGATVLEGRFTVMYG